MGDWLIDGLGMDPTYARSLQFLIAAIIVLALIGIFFWIFRRVSGGSLMKVARSRQHRLSVMDATSVDARRRLVLVRRDNVEHLLLIGGPTDVVVEEGIMRGVPASQGARSLQVVPGGPGQASANEQPAAAMPLPSGTDQAPGPALHPAASVQARRPTPPPATRPSPQNMAPSRPAGQTPARQPITDSVSKPQLASAQPSRQGPSRLQPAGQSSGPGAGRLSTPQQGQFSPSPRGNPRPQEPAPRAPSARASGAPDTPASHAPSARRTSGKNEKPPIEDLQDKVANLGARQKKKPAAEPAPPGPEKTAAPDKTARQQPAAPAVAAAAPAVSTGAPEKQADPTANLAADFEDALLGPNESDKTAASELKVDDQDFAGDLMRTLEQPAPVPQSTRQRAQKPAGPGSIHPLRPEAQPEQKSSASADAAKNGVEPPKAPEATEARKGPDGKTANKETDAETFDSIEEEMAKLLNEIGGNSR